MFKTKILVLGMCRSGKTVVANFLADATDYTVSDYRPTQGVRIVEFESSQLQINGKSVDADVELWDCSGDRKFEKCWPAIQFDASGIILVACKQEANQQLQELEFWFVNFVQKCGIKHSNVRVYLVSKNDSSLPNDKEKIKLLPSMSHIQIFDVDLERGGDFLRNEFNNFLCSVITEISTQRDKDEQGFIS
uniref:Intraflagellar transport protein 22 homolog n=1 Tax=Romanomermis culicivorax TaxID=13658 RepID=A0A915KAP5_ROMCU